jgi:C1A family cysteine protease
MRTPRKFGYIKDDPDTRDYIYTLNREFLAVLPPKASVQALCPPVYDQGNLGSCVANAVSSLVSFAHLDHNFPDPKPSRLFIYYNARVIEGDPLDDSGCQIRDAIKSTVKQGVCPEKEWPYDITRFAVQPSDPCYTDALSNRVVSYHSIPQSIDLMKGCIAEGFPFAIGIQVYDNFPMDIGINEIPMPAGRVVGGHAIDIVGYSDTNRMFLMRNSWGSSWGDNGYASIPYDYLSDPNLANDLWTIRTTLDEQSPNPVPPVPAPSDGCLAGLLKKLGLNL